MSEIRHSSHSKSFQIKCGFADGQICQLAVAKIHAGRGRSCAKRARRRVGVKSTEFRVPRRYLPFLNILEYSMVNTDLLYRSTYLHGNILKSETVVYPATASSVRRHPSTGVG